MPHSPSKGVAADGYANTSAPASNLYSPYLSIECIAALDARSFIAAPDAELSRRPAAVLDRGESGRGNLGYLSLPAIGAIEKYELSS
jgi:hypothetical protein